MIHRIRRNTDRQLLPPCVLEAGNIGQEHRVDDGILPCPYCSVRCSALEDTARYLTTGVSQTWTGISAAITARRTELDEVLDRLAGTGAGPGADADGGRPIRTLVVSPSEHERAALVARMEDDPRFTVAGTGSTPAEVVPLAARDLPDLVLVHLPDLAGRSLEDLAELGRWSPSSVVVVVAGLDVMRAGDLVVKSGVSDSWPRREPSRTGGGNPSGRGAAGRTDGNKSAGPARGNPPRSIIQEAMRQIGVPMRRTP